MADLLAHERATFEQVVTLLKTPDITAQNVLEAFNYYRPLAEAAVCADFQNAESHEMRLWNAHTDGKRWFSKKLRSFRKNHSDKPVEERVLTKHYLEFLKQSELFYRFYINKVNDACGGIPELEEIAHMTRAMMDRSGESQQVSVPIPPLSKDVAKISCHRSFIFLGDLARYRASDKLDQNPNFGPSIGWYGLAASLLPFSGLGHHQQAVVALESGNHLRAIYHLYRSICVPEAHPHGLSNLGKEFEKINGAWDKGELIQKGRPNDPDASKHALVGWFVRFHSMCYKGEPFRGHDELEREVLSQLSNVIKQRPLDEVLQRMILTNIAAQYVAGERFQGKAEMRVRRKDTDFCHS